MTIEIKHRHLNPLEVYRASTPPISDEIIDAAVVWVDAEAHKLPAGPCPAWCDQPEGHGWRTNLDLADLRFERGHNLELGGSVHNGDVEVYIQATDTLNDDGAVTPGVPGIFHSSSYGDPLEDAATAYRFGEALIRAARKLEQITAAGL